MDLHKGMAEHIGAFLQHFVADAAEISTHTQTLLQRILGYVFCC
jgi:hypothetical protein